MAFLSEREMDLLRIYGGGERLCGQDVKEREEKFKKGRIYDVLESLEHRGLLASKLEPGKRGIQRNVYWITASGRKVLQGGEVFLEILRKAGAVAV
jgi:DNA-binding PadR family transcriptional regulator